MFKIIKRFILRLFWSLLPNFSFFFNWLSFNKIFKFLRNCIIDLRAAVLPLRLIIQTALVDIRLIILKYYDWVKNLLFQYRLAYIIRLAFLIFLLYRPTLIELDSFYWTLSVFFYFLSNNFFFFSSYIIPIWDWSFDSPTLYALSAIFFFPALWTSRRFKRRAKKRHKIILRDDEVYLAFYWAQRIFVSTFYFAICYASFFFISIFLSLIYLYLTDLDFANTSMFFFFAYVYSTKYFPLFSKLLGNGFIFFAPIFFKFFLNFLYVFFELYVFTFLTWFGGNLLFIFVKLSSWVVLFTLSILSLYLYSVFEFIKDLALISLLLKSSLSYEFDIVGFYKILDVFKNFLFSDNFFIFIFLILKFVLNFFLSVSCYFVKVLFSCLSFLINLLIPASVLSILSANFMFLRDLVVLNFCSFIIDFLGFVIKLLNSYFADLTFFGLISTWYGYLSHGVQRGVLYNSFANWVFIHLYASIIAFWFLDFDFRVSVKTPPKTPNTLLKEAKRTHEWIPHNMDFLTLQISESKIYFAMLDISFEHVESLQFIYGDFEYIDEEYDMEDDTPDEEEWDNESEETLKVREIIESDLGFTKRPTKMTEDDPLNSKSGLERHYLGEIVGEPELVYVEEALTWAFSSLYFPTFEELHFRDSLFSDWIFDPDEDLTFFEFLLLLPFLLFCVYVWFFHRRRKKHYRAYLRMFIPVRRTVFSGWWLESFLGFPVGEWVRYFFDKMRKYTAPDAKFRNVYRFRMFRNRQKFKLMQLESWHFERLRLKLYRDTLKSLEDFTGMSVRFLAPNRKRHYLYSTVRKFKQDTRSWALMGDWSTYFWKPLPRAERVSYFFDWLQVSVPHLIDKYINKGRRKKKFRRNLWRTIQHIPGHLSMPFIPKQWYSRFDNTFLFFPVNNTKYNYSYYNYFGWRHNRTEWKRYAFTPGNVTDQVFWYNRGLQRRDYNLYKRYLRRRRLMRVLQF